jgi:hypothetical protein
MTKIQELRELMVKKELTLEGNSMLVTAYTSMSNGFVYAPYIPLQMVTIDEMIPVDESLFEPRSGYKEWVRKISAEIDQNIRKEMASTPISSIITMDLTI